MKKRLLGWIASPLTGLAFGAVCLVYQTVYTFVPGRLAIQGSVLAYLSPALAVADRETFVSALAATLMPSAPAAVRLPSITTSALL